MRAFVFIKVGSSLKKVKLQEIVPFEYGGNQLLVETRRPASAPAPRLLVLINRREGNTTSKPTAPMIKVKLIGGKKSPGLNKRTVAVSARKD